jgi:CheY-like chemotaxis protein
MLYAAAGGAEGFRFERRPSAIGLGVFVAGISGRETPGARGMSKRSPRCARRKHQMHSEPRPTILNVDDDPGGRDATTRVLEREGFVVKEADTGSEALRLAETMPDLILLGVHLPDVSGLEVCRRLKQEPRTHSIPIVHLSANPVAPESRTAALECGADAYLKHPLDPGLLVATIRALLRARRA